MLHHAGGSSQVFTELISALPASIEVLPLDLAGRGRRWREPPAVTVEQAIDDLLLQIAGNLADRDFAIFGHSMGAYLGLAVAARLDEACGGSTRCPVLFASSNAGPRSAHPLFAEDPLAARDSEVLDVAQRFGDLAPGILQHEQLLSRAVRLLRADFAVCDSFIRTLTKTRANSQLIVCYGEDDIFTESELSSWRLSSTGPTRLLPFRGAHFYLTQQAAELAEVILPSLSVRSLLGRYSSGR
jgi:surfactin synthase thioesterase subunit